jgi:hypothetical protein
MKDFVLYIQSKQPYELAKEEYLIEDLQNQPASSTISGIEKVEWGRLKLVRQSKLLNVFSFECKFQLPKPKAVKEDVYGEYECTIYQQREGNIVASIDAPKKLSKIIFALLSYATQGDPSLIRPVNLLRQDFLALKKYILAKSGDLRQLIFWELNDVPGECAHIRQFRLSGSHLERLVGFEDLLKRTKKIQLLGFGYKPTKESRELRFRLIEWGGGQLYTPADPLDHEILEFLELFNQTLIPGNQTNFSNNGSAEENLAP